MEKNGKKLLNEIKEIFEKDKVRNIFKKYIEYIRFPFFKNFEKDLKVNFTFPITFIVGQNGSGKSSLLHALYGAPRNYSIATYWFDTALDPIEYIKTNRHCFIYSYFAEYSKKIVEVIKLRIQVKDKKTGKIDLDYWEPSRPYKKYFMIPPQEGDDKRDTSATKDRWNPISRSVYHMDFRYSLSAYDKYFYFGSKPNTKTLKSKQDVIRKYASRLKKAFEDNTEIIFRTRKVKRTTTLTSSELSSIRYILGKNYTETKITEHNIYDKRMGFAIRYKTNNLSYSEAYAGSGETAVVKLVHDLYSTEDYSLVLLDEPETSLHPLAQKRLVTFILEQIKRKKLQVVISTHSPDIIEEMPKEAIKIFYENQESGKVNIIENVHPENAFVYIGRSITDKKVIVVEDILAKMIVEKVLGKTGNSELFEIKYFPNGESIIKKEFMLVYSKEESNNHFVIFDGDQKTNKISVDDLLERDKTVENLKQKINDVVKQSIEFAVDGGESGGREDQKIELMLKYIKYHHDNVFFLPKNIPEEIIWSDDVLTRADISEDEKQKIKSKSDYKNKLNLFAKCNFGGDTVEYRIKAYEYFLLRWLKKENYDYKEIVSIINIIKER